MFRSRHLSWIKVGHHKITARRPNVYYRVAGRGFSSVRHPEELKGKLGIRDFDLVAWYPALDTADERYVHNECRTTASVGEFHPLPKLSQALQICDSLAERAPVSKAQYNAALAWASLKPL